MRVAVTRFGVTAQRPTVPGAGAVDLVIREISEAPELWHQRGYLARVLTLDPAAGLVDDGVQPLAYWLDSGGDDGLAMTLEADGTGAIYPVLFGRRGGRILERALDPDPLLRHDGPAARRAVESVVAELFPGVTG